MVVESIDLRSLPTFMRISKRIASVFGALAVAAMLLATKLACSHAHTTQPSNPIPAVQVQPPLDPRASIKFESLGSPIHTARTWATALAPNRRGGWNFITQSYELNTSTPPEFVVLDLETGKTTISNGSVYTNKKFQVTNELRAPNGRIFFPEADVSMAYYDPADETVKELGRLIDPPNANRIFYSAIFGPDGKLYLGTESNKLPTIVQLDPITLKARVLGEVGKSRISYSYAYYLVADPPWVYVAVGQNPWELAALNIDTGESKILATRSDKPWMTVELRPEGVIATLINGLRTPQATKDIVWCADGKVFPSAPRYDPAKLPFKARNTRILSAPPENPPEINLDSITPDAKGIGRVRWRAKGSTAPWNETTYTVKNTSPIALESLIALPDGSVLGSAVQYHGFFRYNPADKSTTYFGQHEPSQPVHAISNGIVYIAGYPNGVLYGYDPAKPWHSTSADKDRTDPSANPQFLGNFTQTGTHYAAALVAAKNGRLYYAGRRERDGLGGGVGYYDPATKQFAGHHEDLNFLDPQGFVVLDDVQRIVYSGKLRDDPGKPNEPQLIVFDEELKEVDRQVVKPGLVDTGRLFPTAEPNVIIGLVGSEKAIYRYDIAKKAVLDWKPLSGAVGNATQRPTDLSIWLTLDRRLVRIDSSTLAIMSVGQLGALPDKTEHLEWQGNDLYLNVKDELFRIAQVGIR